MKQTRRDFLKKSLKVGALATLTTSAFASQKVASEPDSNGVVVGKSKKKEVLYAKSEFWDKYYKIAY
ncbi:twin-arginine translocation signal domain-containing protein [Campylobacter gastrosuis]|uniref:Twin-arginine translocation signal domain-containing protein n=1 Tax=Campylobacter gastrosuis TaxID=2974576 RepID=A0ABT7HM87_9BACT|nr:twin-arginine translocation signal domain-containing protein [Campylobacter gastrosuis]MDL0087785.1 twin-arginine translocation signal domain-containing protein [Campylobacter gastrosuis]MDL0087996.1 twin-arginine translocation signal domain-containing protein [Campylobacter gastrosuis]